MRSKKILFYVLAMLIGGCMPVMSLNQLYTDQNIVFEQNLLGTWEPNDSNLPNETIKFEQGETKSFKLTYKDKEGRKGLFKAFLVKLDSDIYMDISPAVFPNQPPDVNEANLLWPHNMFLYQPLHLFVKVEFKESRLLLRLMLDDCIKKLFKEHPDAVKYDTVDKKIILTDSTEKLQEFVKKYKDDKNLFTAEPITLVKIDKTEAVDPNQADKK